ncbi:hypothetical protein [Embleya sp. NPDC050493]|uniref:hypothetical protein n=1 Tax=Embleya sp. NPDC050493 TaxID=3363989 RepID=UPI0037B71F21
MGGVDPTAPINGSSGHTVYRVHDCGDGDDHVTVADFIAWAAAAEQRAIESTFGFAPRSMPHEPDPRPYDAEPSS